MQSSSYADAERAMAHLLVRDLVLSASIGIHDYEHQRRQRVRINLDLAIPDWGGTVPEDIAGVVSYEPLVDLARRLMAERHWPLVETLAEALAQGSLALGSVERVRVRVEKLDVYDDAAAVGVEIERRRLPNSARQSG